MSAPVALVTGGQQGIGLGIAAALTDAGFACVLAAERAADDPAVVAALDRLGPAARYLRHDLSETGGEAALLDAVEAEAGPVAAFVSNAGVPPLDRVDMLEAGRTSFDLALAVNLRGAFFLAQEVARRMLAGEETAADASSGASTGGGAARDVDTGKDGGTERNRGTERDETAGRAGGAGQYGSAKRSAAAHPRSMIFVTSVSAEMASTNRAEYCISKAGAAMMARLFAARLAPHGISVVELRPGIVETAMTAAAKDKYDTRIAEGLVPAGRWGQPRDIGAVVVPVAKGTFAFASGATIAVDGGLSLPRL